MRPEVLCVQKSIREGLVVSETLSGKKPRWSQARPAASRSRCGTEQGAWDGEGGFLVHSDEECAEKILHLLQNPAEGAERARRGKELVREHFLLTRLIANELTLYASLLGASPEPRISQARGTHP